MRFLYRIIHKNKVSFFKEEIGSVYIILLIFILFIGCSSKSLINPMEKVKINEIDSFFSELKRSFMAKDYSLFSSLFGSDYQIDVGFKKDVLNVFKQNEKIEIDFTIDSIMIESQGINVPLYWVESLKDHSTGEVHKRNGNSLFRLDVKGENNIKIIKINGDNPFNFDDPKSELLERLN